MQSQSLHARPSRSRLWTLLPLAVGGALAGAVVAQAPVTDFIAEAGIIYPPQDVAITPNGSLAVVRAAGPTGLMGPAYTDQITVWDTATGSRLPITTCSSRFGRGAVTIGYTSDALAITNDVAVAIGSSEGAAGPDTRTQIDVVRLSGGPIRCGGNFTIDGTTFGNIAGLPSDVAITPNGQQAVVHHRNWVHILNLNVEPALITGFNFPNGFPGPQSDSVAVTNTRAIVSSTEQFGAGPRTVVRIFDIADPNAPTLLSTSVFGDGINRPHDVAITPDGTKAVVTSSNRFGLFNLATGALQISPTTLDHDRSYGAPAKPVDSVELTNDRAVIVAQDTNPQGWIIEVWNLAPTLSKIYDFGTQENYEVHDLAVRQFGPAVFAAINLGSPLWGSTQGYFVILRGLEAGATPEHWAAASTGSPFELPSTVFCSDSIDIAGVGVGGNPPTICAVGLSADLYPGTDTLIGRVTAFDLRTWPPTLINSFLTLPPSFDEDGMPVDLALAHHGEDVLVRNWAPPTEADPSAGGFDLMRFRVTGQPGQQVVIEGQVGGTGDEANLRLFACDSIVSAGDYTVSIAELTTGPNKGIVHFVKNSL